MKARLVHLLLILATAPLSAAVITVGASGCDHTTLASAIAAAQPGDELRLRAQTFSGVSERVTASLTIRGGYTACGNDFPGLSSSSVLEGTGIDHLLTIEGGASTTVELVNLELSGGGNAAFGGAVSVHSGATLRLATTEMYGNAGDLGGAIYVGENSILAHTGPVTLRDNVAHHGGAIYVAASGTVAFDTGGFNSVTISGNLASEGGGIFVGEGGTLRTSANRALILDNNRAQVGGGIRAGTSANVELVGDTIRGNLASIAGGGLFVAGDGSPVSIPTIVIDRDTEFESNQAAIGGGAAFGFGGGYQARIAATFRANSALQHGGGMAIDGNGVFDLGRAFFSANLAGTHGGGLSADGAALIAGFLSFVGNRAEVDGGALRLTGATSLQVGSQLIVSRNEAGRSGGGLAIQDGAFLQVDGGNGFSDLLATFNIAESGNGGALHVLDGQIDLSGAVLGGLETGNQAVLGQGGGAYINTDLAWSILNSRINGNRAAGQGAGIHIEGGADFRLGAETVGGTAPGRTTQPCDPFALEPGEYCAEVRGNASDDGAGGISIISAGAAIREIVDLALIDNRGTNPAAGLLIDAPGVVVRNALIARNAGSSAVFVKSGHDVHFEHVSLLFNERGALANSNVDWVVEHSLFWGNGSFDLGLGVDNTIVGSCNLGRSPALPDAIHAYPRFIATQRGLYRLSDQSPAIDGCAGGLLARDLDGLDRPAGGATDIGALEGAWGTAEILLYDGFEEGLLASPTP